MSLIGIDIGGANLKFSDGGGRHFTRAFELWRQPGQLSRALAEALATFPLIERTAIAMTGELCDCFETRAEGVARIVAAVEELPAGLGRGRYYQVGGQFVDAPRAVSSWQLTAAANWDAIARYAAQCFPDDQGVLLDIGSTTTDLIPFRRGEVTAAGTTDYQRLRSGELVYCGAARTPLGSILPEFSWEGERLGLAAEWFASFEDVSVLRGEVAERPDDLATCDGRPLTRACSLRRLARMLCTEPEEAGEAMILELAGAIDQAWLDRLERAWRLQESRGARAEGNSLIVLSGSGERLGRRLLKRVGWNGRVAAWSELFSPAASEAAAAFALARLGE